MPDIWERKQGEKFKEKSGTPAAKKNIRQQMTAKIRRELVAKAQDRNTDYSETPEAEAMDQVQNAAQTTGREIKDASVNTVSKSVKKSRERREKRKATRERPETLQGQVPAGDAPPAPNPFSPPQMRERMIRKATGDLQEQNIDTRQEQFLPRERPAAEATRERPINHRADQAKPAQASTPPARERMQQTAVKDLRTKHTEAGREQPALKEHPTANIPHEQLAQRHTPSNSPPPSPSPRERMRENTIREKKAQIGEVRERQRITREQEPTTPRERPSPEVPLIKVKTPEINLPGGKLRELPRAGHSKRPTPDRSIAPEPPPARQTQFPAPYRDTIPSIAPEPPPMRQAQFSATFRDTAPAPHQPQKQMRKKAIKEKQTATRQRGPVQSGPKQAAPVRNSPPERISLYETQTPPGKRMLEIYRSRRAEELRQQPPPSVAPAPECPPPPAAIIPEKHSISLEHQSANPSVKERPRRGNSPKEKPTGGAFLPKTRQSSAIQTRSAKAATPGGKGAARQIRDKARQRVQRNAQRTMLQTSRKAAQTAGSLTKKAAVVTAKAAKALFTALAGLLGGGILLPVIIVIILVAAIIASPFGILFSNEPTPGATPLNIAVGQLNRKLSNTLEELQEGEYDEIDIEGQAPDWREVVAVFAAKTAGAEDGVDVAALTPDRLDRLKAVFWDMCQVSAEVEEIDHEDSDPNDGEDDSWTEKILHIKIESKSADDMRTEYDFTTLQSEALDELIDELATMELLITDLTATEEQARELLENLPDDLAPERRAVVETACELVGKVTYFWGGKSLLIGWDDRWGRVTKVWAEGSITTGTYRPYGLDCSGFADWTFYNATEGAYYPGHGGGTLSQLADSTQISWAEAQPGDLVFASDVSHVGIVGGWDPDGNLLIIHCTSGSVNGVTISGTYGFGIVARPRCFAE